jgi:hypothetical protein
MTLCPTLCTNSACQDKLSVNPNIQRLTRTFRESSSRGASSNGPKNNDKKLQWHLEPMEQATFVWITRSFPEKRIFRALAQAACKAKGVFLTIPYRCFWVRNYSTPINYQPVVFGTP